MTNTSKLNLISDLIGKPFVDGGRGPSAFDCWGITMEAFRRLGYQLPEYPISSQDFEAINNQIAVDRPKWLELKTPVAPCVVLMRLGVANLVNHCGVYLGDGKMLHIREKTGAVIERIETPVIKAIIKGFVQPPEEYKS